MFNRDNTTMIQNTTSNKTTAKRGLTEVSKDELALISGGNGKNVGKASAKCDSVSVLWGLYTHKFCR